MCNCTLIFVHTVKLYENVCLTSSAFFRSYEIVYYFAPLLKHDTSPNSHNQDFTNILWNNAAYEKNGSDQDLEGVMERSPSFAHINFFSLLPHPPSLKFLLLNNFIIIQS